MLHNQPKQEITIPIEWLNIAKYQIKQCTQKRLYQRMDKLKDVINRKLPSNLPRFMMDNSLKQQICAQVLHVID